MLRENRLSGFLIISLFFLITKPNASVQQDIIAPTAIDRNSISETHLNVEDINNVTYSKYVNFANFKSDETLNSISDSNLDL